MEHTIYDFKHYCDDTVYADQEQFSREEVKALLWGQIAAIHNDVNNIIYEHAKKQTLEQGQKLRNYNEEETDIMSYLKEPRCVSF